jgi:cell division septum initiation protein DivIVA
MENNDREKLVAAFEHMVENVSESMHKAEEALAPTIDEMVHNAQQLAREVFTLTQEEAESLGATLKRDMHKANEAMNQQSKELKDWFSFDLELVEDRFIVLLKMRITRLACIAAVKSVMPVASVAANAVKSFACPPRV